MEKVFKIYKITNLITERVYIGQTSMSIEKRWYYHSRPDSQCSYIHRSMLKHGIKNFKIEWIASALCCDDIDDLEDSLIRSFNSIAPYGYNLKYGGSHPTMSDVVKEQMSESHKLRHINMSKEEKTKSMSGITKYVESKKRPIIGINSTRNIIEFESGYEASESGFHVDTSLSDKYTSTKGYRFYYKDEHNIDEMLELYEAAEIEKNKRKIEWGNKTSQKLLENAEKRTDTHVVAVNPITEHHVIYLNMGRAIKDGHASSSVQQSLRGENSRSKGYHFFKAEEHTIEEMFELAEKTNDRIKKSQLAGRKKAVANMQDHINSQKIPYIGINTKTFEYHTFESNSEAARKGYNTDAIRRGNRGEKRTTKGLHFQKLTLSVEEHIEITQKIFK